MCKLSVIIVNYNVKYFLEQCIHSIEKSTKEIDHEIIVVDNNSVDSSCNMMKTKFPNITLIENKSNVGFSKANNQAIKQASGEYICIINPDTVVQENTFSKCITFMDEHPDAGALGVKMIDGKGHFLAESKRSLPTPEVAFYKIFGISRLFPKSKIFGKYHLGYLNKNKTHAVDVLPGAFMLIRKEALDKTGLLDESFFMYGEDIDLSYRITKAGYKNYYYPETTIIHYKGESTKKDTINYVMVFYRAMIIFAKKHFSSRNAKLFSFLINIAIYLRASISIAGRFIKSLFLPAVDVALINAGYHLLIPLWEQYKFNALDVYPKEFTLFIIPAFSILWAFSVFLYGGYDTPIKLPNIIKGLLLGTFLILIIYALMPENLRFSRALIILGALWTILSITTLRLILHFIHKDFKLAFNTKKRIAIVGNYSESSRVKEIINQTDIKPNILGYISPSTQFDYSQYIGSINQLPEIIKINKIDEVVFCAKEIQTKEIIKNMLLLSPVNVDFKIAPPESLSIIGSNSINTSGELYTINVNSIGKRNNIRKKRIFDFCSSLLILLLFPLLIIFIKKPFKGLKNILLVLCSRKSWVGYHQMTNEDFAQLPFLKAGIFSPADALSNKKTSDELYKKLNILYAKDYKTTNDLSILIKNINKLGK